MMRFVVVGEYAAPMIVHYERDPKPPTSGGAGGTTMCGRDFVPRTKRWTRDGRLISSRSRSCAKCLEIAREIAQRSTRPGNNR